MHACSSDTGEIKAEDQGHPWLQQFIASLWRVIPSLKKKKGFRDDEERQTEHEHPELNTTESWLIIEIKML